MDYARYTEYFSPAKLWEKLSSIGTKAGVKIVYVVLLLYYTALDPNTSIKDKAIIFGVLGYFILPVDLLPDAIPVIGYTDDLSALIAAYKAVKGNITPAVKAKARKRLKKWFRNVDLSKLKVED